MSRDNMYHQVRHHMFAFCFAFLFFSFCIVLHCIALRKDMSACFLYYCQLPDHVIFGFGSYVLYCYCWKDNLGQCWLCVIALESESDHG
jgi:hypothetical protein